MKKILVITASFDRTVDYFINRFRGKAFFYRINTDRFYDYSFSIECKNGNLIYNVYDSYTKEDFTLEDIDSIYYRKPYYPQIKDLEPKYKDFLYREFTSFLIGFVENFEGKVLTKPLILKRAENKLIQLKIAKDIGFKIPNTLITNSPLDANRIIKPNKWITKPLSYGRIGDKAIHTNIVKDKNFDGLELIPVYFQEYINKEFELRLTVANKKFFPVKIISDNKIDWRKGNNKYSLIEISKDLQEKCLLYMNIFHLNFCAFDFIYDGKDYYFLEGNPNGQWLWLEKILSIKISEEIFKFLTN